jgi:response regulator RpfG family c-di-GMP phosphodiesterase
MSQPRQYENIAYDNQDPSSDLDKYAMQDCERHSILIAEDNPDDIVITKRAWKKGNIKNKLYIAKDGEEALDFLYKRGKYVDAPDISLLLLDLNMPKMDGFEVKSCERRLQVEAIVGYRAFFFE